MFPIIFILIFHFIGDRIEKMSLYTFTLNRQMCVVGCNVVSGSYSSSFVSGGIAVDYSCSNVEQERGTAFVVLLDYYGTILWIT